MQIYLICGNIPAIYPKCYNSFRILTLRLTLLKESCVTLFFDHAIWSRKPTIVVLRSFSKKAIDGSVLQIYFCSSAPSICEDLNYLFRQTLLSTICTLCCISLGRCCFGLETRVIIKIYIFLLLSLR